MKFTAEFSTSDFYGNQICKAKTLYCGVPGIGEDVTDYIGCRPDSCPLRELPEKIPESKSEYEKVTTSVKRIGWNECLDAILENK